MQQTLWSCLPEGVQSPVVWLASPENQVSNMKADPGLGPIRPTDAPQRFLSYFGVSGFFCKIAAVGHKKLKHQLGAIDDEWSFSCIVHGWWAVVRFVFGFFLVPFVSYRRSTLWNVRKRSIIVTLMNSGGMNRWIVE